MFDFLRVSKAWDSKKQRYVYTPKFVIKSTIKDLMIRGRDFYAIYNEESGLWEMTESRAIELIDAQVRDYATKDAGDTVYDEEHGPLVKLIEDTDNRLISQWHTYCQKDMRDNWIPLDQKIIFSNQEPTRSDHVSKVLDYPLQEGSTEYYNKILDATYGGLYLPTELEKMEWMIGCALAGDGKKIQKMLVLYGQPGTGKGTAIDIYKSILESGAITFEAKTLCGHDAFGADFLENDSVMAFDSDAEMSIITSKTTLNKIISHERIRVNVKFKAPFYVSPNCLLVVASNDPIQLAPNSGMNRRVIDVRPTGKRIPSDEYDDYIEHVPFEKSGIAYKCLATYKKLGRHYYDHYVAEDMLSRTSPFQNFVTENYIFLKGGVSLANAYKRYCDYAQESNFKNILVRYKFRDTLKLYFNKYEDGKFSDFKPEMIGMGEQTDYIPEKKDSKAVGWLVLNKTVSLLDKVFADCKAQYEQDNPDHPLKYDWDHCPTTLKDLDTSKVHHLLPPDSTYITMDFDIYGEDGEKNFDLNLAAAEKFPPTYAEVSKSGSGIHLEYKYTGGDPDELSRIFGPNIEIKVFTGKASLRRKVTLCNDLPIAELSSGLPLKEVKKKVFDEESFVSESKLVNCIKKALRKGYNELPSTKQNIFFIEELLKEAFGSGKTYDVRMLRPAVTKFGLSSHHNADKCKDVIGRMLWCSQDVLDAEKVSETVPDPAATDPDYDSRPIIFLDCEIFPSYMQAVDMGVDVPDDIPADTPALFLVNWKFDNDEETCVRMVNPRPREVEDLFDLYRVIGFNNRNYDNHMLYARAQGYTSEELYELSSRLINNRTAMQARFGAAYNLSYTDVYDLASAGNKMGLKKWEIKLMKLGKVKHHIEWNHPWNQPVPQKDWERVAEYCDNDVITTQALYHHLKDDVLAREILAALAKPYGGTMNSTTNQLTNMIVFEGNKYPGLIYTDFSTGKQYGPDEPFKMPIMEWDEYVALGDDWTGAVPVNQNHFPGYHLVRDKNGKLHNMYRGVDVGFGGYVYATPGMYGRAVTKDVASMHPHSIKELNLFDKYTQNYVDLMDARIFIKHGDYEDAKKLFNGALAPYLTDEKAAKNLSKALKTALNSAYGLTSASFQNAMKDSRNINNIVALRGALVMKQLQDTVESMGFTVIHIKTDSIKIANPTDELLDYIDNYGKEYGYTYEVEHTWEKICLVNKAVFIGRHDTDDPDYISNPDKSNKDFPNRWEAVGTQFQIPYVFKSLFSHEKIDFYDMCETINVMSGSLHLIYKGKVERDIFVGRVGLFCPMKVHGGQLIVRRDDGRVAAPAGTKDYIWMETETVQDRNLEDDINLDYYKSKCDEAIETISQFGDFNTFSEV